MRDHAAQSRLLLNLSARPCSDVLGRGEASCRRHLGSGSQETRTRHYAPETNGVVERLKRSPGVRAPLPLRACQRGRARRGGRKRPAAPRRGQAAWGAGAADPTRGAPRRSTPLSGTTPPTSLTVHITKRFLEPVLGQSPADAARPALYAATSPDVTNGGFYPPPPDASNCAAHAARQHTQPTRSTVTDA